VASCEHGNKLSDSINGKNFMTSWSTISLSRRTLFLKSWCTHMLLGIFRYSFRGFSQSFLPHTRQLQALRKFEGEARLNNI
jgi:hypothetical protein